MSPSGPLETEPQARQGGNDVGIDRKVLPDLAFFRKGETIEPNVHIRLVIHIGLREPFGSVSDGPQGMINFRKLGRDRSDLLDQPVALTLLEKEKRADKGDRRQRNDVTDPQRDHRSPRDSRFVLLFAFVSHVSGSIRLTGYCPEIVN
jgi:hypothetical protein